MNAHEQLDGFLNSSPRTKVILLITLLVLTAAAFGVTYWLGTIKGNEWADSKYLQERDKNLQIAADAEVSAATHRANETQLAAENALLRKQHEATAEILKANDAKLAGDAHKLIDLMEKRNEKFDQIDLDTDYKSQLCGLCTDAESSGFKLSADFCRRCKAAPQNNSGP